MFTKILINSIILNEDFITIFPNIKKIMGITASPVTKLKLNLLFKQYFTDYFNKLFIYLEVLIFNRNTNIK